MNPALIALLPVAIQVVQDIASAIKEAHETGIDPSPEKMAAIQASSDSLNATWASLAPKDA